LSSALTAPRFEVYWPDGDFSSSMKLELGLEFNFACCIGSMVFNLVIFKRETSPAKEIGARGGWRPLCAYEAESTTKPDTVTSLGYKIDIS
jgi:hypothetical protein